MPDSRRHRGANPEDAQLFAADQLPALRRSSAELAWLLDHGYALRSSLALVGDRHGLTARQRLALARSACTATQRDDRRQREVSADNLASAEVWIDGYNLLITVESALAGGFVFVGRDGCYRDLASLHGTYREVAETIPALQVVGEMLPTWAVAKSRWILDQPVSNSGKLRMLMLQLAAASEWGWSVQLEFNPDTFLATSSAIVASSDSVVIDRCSRWTNVARNVVTAKMPDSRLIEFEW